MFAWAFLENCFKSNYLALPLTLSLMFWTFCKTSSKLFFLSNFFEISDYFSASISFFFQLERSKILNSGSARSLKASNYLVFTANKSYIFKAWFLPRILELFPKWGRGFPFEERFRHLQVLPFLGFSSRSKILTNFRTLAKSPFFKEKWL